MNLHIPYVVGVVAVEKWYVKVDFSLSRSLFVSSMPLVFFSTLVVAVCFVILIKSLWLLLYSSKFKNDCKKNTVTLRTCCLLNSGEKFSTLAFFFYFKNTAMPPRLFQYFFLSLHVLCIINTFSAMLKAE